MTGRTHDLAAFTALRVKTGGFLEKTFVFPGLIFLNVYIFYIYYDKFLDFFKSLIK